MVTGGGRGIGAAIATRAGGRGRQAHADGPHACAACRRRPRRCRRHGRSRCDVTDEAAVARRVRRRPAKPSGRSTILVNNAGAAEVGAVRAHLARAAPSRCSTSTWSARSCAAAPCCRTCSRRASAASSTSRASPASRAHAYVTAYCAAKHGVVGLTRALALETASKGITVNAVCPGYTDTDLVRRAIANIVAEDRAQRRRGRGGAGREESAGPADPPGRGGSDGALAVRAGRRGDHRPGDRDRRRRGRDGARPNAGTAGAATPSGGCACGCACTPRPA